MSDIVQIQPDIGQVIDPDEEVWRLRGVHALWI